MGGFAILFRLPCGIFPYGRFFWGFFAGGQQRGGEEKKDSFHAAERNGPEKDGRLRIRVTATGLWDYQPPRPVPERPGKLLGGLPRP